MLNFHTVKDPSSNHVTRVPEIELWISNDQIGSIFKEWLIKQNHNLIWQISSNQKQSTVYFELNWRKSNSIYLKCFNLQRSNL